MHQDGLTQAINTLYPAPISDMDAKEAASNLLSFMELLMEIDREHGITSASEGRVQPCK